MKKREESFEYNTHIMDVVSLSQQKLQKEMGTDWWYGKSVFSRILTVIYEIMFYFTLLWNTVVMASYITLINRYKGYSNWVNERAIYLNAFRAFLFGTLLLIIAYAFKKAAFKLKKPMLKKRHIRLMVQMICSAVGGVLLAITAFNVLVRGNIDSVYAEAVDTATPFKIYMELICLHILPLLLIIFCAIMFFVMNRCDYSEKLSLYKSLTGRLYTQFIKDNPSYSQSQWEEFLNNYTDENPPERQLTRSEKAKLKKNKKHKSKAEESTESSDN